MKKLFYVLLGVVLVSMIFTTTSCVNKNDIRGTWTLTYQWGASSPAKVMVNSKVSSEKVYISYTNQITFNGEKDDEGDLYAVEESGKMEWGIWSYNGTNIRWTFSNTTTYSGKVKDENYMSGTMVGYTGSTGTWSATR